MLKKSITVFNSANDKHICLHGSLIPERYEEIKERVALSS